MYTNKKWQIAARNRRLKAALFAFTFHLALLAGIVYAADKKVSEILPEFAKEWLFETDKDGLKEKGEQPKA